MKHYAVMACAVLISGCTSVVVKPVDPALNMQFVCIQKNPKVQVDDFIPVLRDGLSRHGVASEVFSGQKPKKCEYILTYTALRSWDIATYLSHAELRIEKEGRLIASAEYHLNGKGGLSLTKWAGTREKMDPVIDQLFSQ